VVVCIVVRRVQMGACSAMATKYYSVNEIRGDDVGFKCVENCSYSYSLLDCSPTRNGERFGRDCWC